MSDGFGQLSIGQAQQAMQNAELEQLKQQFEAGQRFSAEDESKLREQATKFETLFVNMMLSTMRKTVEQSDLFGDAQSSSRQIYTSMLDGEYARIMAETQSLGLSKLMLQHFGVEANSVRPDPASADMMIMPSPDVNGASQENLYLSPLQGRISSPFGMRVHPISGQMAMHDGVDIAVPIGTDVQASAAGRVVFAGEQRGYGNVVILEHEGGRQSLYGHLDSIGVKEGDVVERGQVIAESGNSGVSTGPHLHFEIRLGGKPVNPVDFVRKN